MPLPIEDYALIGNGRTAALVGRDGSIDWMCVPRFDAPACFAALLGSPDNGRWLICPAGKVTATRRRYRKGTLVLETEFECDEGTVRVIDVMPWDDVRIDVVRIVEGISGVVSMKMELVVRYDYGKVIPWVRQVEDTIRATAGPDTLELRTRVATRGERMSTVSDFEVNAGERIQFVLNYRLSHEEPLPTLDAEQAVLDTEHRWREWSGKSCYQGRWADKVMRSLITLKALIYEPTGGIVAAPTTSLPEFPGGVRNWDYRYCWLRDATFTLNALLLAGYKAEAEAWGKWLLRAVAGTAEDLQIMYSVTGERRLTEFELDWLPGYMGAAPARIGNAASGQFQLDVYGEVMEMAHLARDNGLHPEAHGWRIQRSLIDFVAEQWHEPDEGIWEIRGPRRHFVHSKVMAWVAFDRAIKDVERFDLPGPVEHWRVVRDQIHAQVCARGIDKRRNCFVQHYDSTDLDASLLLIPAVGFLPPEDPRVVATIEAIQRELLDDAGFVLRYPTHPDVDGLPPGEGAFLPCSFWLVDALVLIGRHYEAEALFERLIGLCNDVGLISEEYDAATGHMLGNFPQALTHMALVNTARLLSMRDEDSRKAMQRGERPAAATS